MKNNMSDWEAKKAFTTKYLYQNNYIPQIYIDDYWNYYIEEYNLTQQEILVILGILGMVAYSDNSSENIDTAYDIVNEKLKAIAKEILAMA